MDIIKITSKRGLEVTMSTVDYTKILAVHGVDGAKNYILDRGSRVYKHRKLLEKIREQSLTDSQRKKVERLATALTIQDEIDKILLGSEYDTYFLKRNINSVIGGARRLMETEMDFIEDLGISSTPVVDDFYRDIAMSVEGFNTESDRNHSESSSSWCSWKITVPEGWGEPDNKL